MKLFGKETEKLLIEYIQDNGLTTPFLVCVISVVLLTLISFGIGWWLSNRQKAATTQKILAESRQIEEDIRTKKELLYATIRLSRDNIVKQTEQLNILMLDLKSRLSHGHSKKANEVRDAICSHITGNYSRALEDHCERIEFLLTGSLKRREIGKHVVPKVQSLLGILDTLNSQELFDELKFPAKPLLFKKSSLEPILETISQKYSRFSPSKRKEFKQLELAVKKHQREASLKPRLHTEGVISKFLNRIGFWRY